MAESEKRGVGLWGRDDCRAWLAVLDGYPEVIEARGNEKLTGLDRWYREELPGLLAGRSDAAITLEELQKIAAWKMTRGVWRERNRVLIGGNAPELVEELSRSAFKAVPDAAKPVTILSGLAGVGPATASAVMAAYAPGVYPFFDEMVAGQIPGLGPVAFTARYYAGYSEALRERAAGLSAACGDHVWTAQDTAQALWAYANGGQDSGL